MVWFPLPTVGEWWGGGEAAFRLLGVDVWRALMELGFIFGIAGFALYHQLAMTASYFVHRPACFVNGVRSTRNGTCVAFGETAYYLAG